MVFFISSIWSLSSHFFRLFRRLFDFLLFDYILLFDFLFRILLCFIILLMIIELFSIFSVPFSFSSSSSITDYFIDFLLSFDDYSIFLFSSSFHVSSIPLFSSFIFFLLIHYFILVFSSDDYFRYFLLFIFSCSFHFIDYSMCFLHISASRCRIFSSFSSHYADIIIIWWSLFSSYFHFFDVRFRFLH